MWTKVNTREQLAALNGGDIIVKYPIFDDTEEVFNPDDSERISVRYVESNNKNVDTMNLSLIFNVVIPGKGAGRFGDIFLYYQDMINCQAYWVWTE